MTIAIPETSTELEELLNDASRLKAVAKEGKLGELVSAYARHQMEAKSGDLAAQIREATQAGMAEFLAGNPAPGTGATAAASMAAGLPHQMKADAAAAYAANAGLNMRNAITRNKLFNKTALGAPLDDEPYAQSIGTYLRAVWHEAEHRLQGDDLVALRDFKTKMRNALLERVPSEGGFLVPERLRSQILMVALEAAVIRPRARIVPMDSLRVPYPTIDDTSHASNVFGGVTAYWTEEAAALTVSQPSFGRVVLEAKKLTAYTTIPNELLQDSVQALDQWFNDMFPLAVAWFEDLAFITGTGVGQPQGFLNSPCAIVGAARAGGAGTAVQFSDIAGLYARMLPYSLNSAIWLCSPDVLPGLLTLITSSSIAPPIWLPNMNAIDSLPGGGTDGFHYRLMGRPLIVSEKMPALSAQGCLAFFDPNYYLLGDRMSMQVSSSEHYQFANDLTAFRVIERVDGRTWIQSAITPENGGNTLSPVVLLHA